MIYLDSAATTYPAQEVIDNYVDALKKFPYNPSSPYEGGLEARKLLEKSRKTVADCLGCKSEEVIFTSGGTEGNNTILQGFFKNKKEGVLITSQIEHPSIFRVAESLEKEGYHVYYLPVDEKGFLNIKDLRSTIKYWIDRGMSPKNILVSIQGANNEIGTAQNLLVIHKLTKQYGVFLHSDQVQLFPHYGADMNCDALTVSGHKFGALRGTGFVYVSKELQKHLSPLLLGGGQEFGMRSGTENVAGFHAMACHIKWLYGYFVTGWRDEMNYLNYFVKKLLDSLHGIEYELNGCADIPIWSLTFPDIEASSLVSLLSEKGVYVAAGSACSSYEAKPSHVLTAIGLSDDDAKSTIRICWHDGLTDEDVDEFTKWLVFYVKLLRGE